LFAHKHSVTSVIRPGTEHAQLNWRNNRAKDEDENRERARLGRIIWAGCVKEQAQRVRWGRGREGAERGWVRHGLNKATWRM